MHSHESCDNDETNRSLFDRVVLIGPAVFVVLAVSWLISVLLVIGAEISDERYEEITQMVEAQPELKGTVARLMEGGCGLPVRHGTCLTYWDAQEIEKRYDILTGKKISDRLARDVGVSID
ncbi:hypothetical protein TK90_2626 (plasmid) [Thioalkalivibrio sp. K90mix]|uniref:hypothetical protein n=1 Tax=Thioalkalivibrio sp. (strain K90mix) TaxID=396595 RepID=UPI000195AB2C|nr:hypothetical protein [Thioalkalivibrio sp. K90mix]ADC73113.1 hypothetical protein TK90_2626 [Thioalkalivibrio sp. K90mix]